MRYNVGQVLFVVLNKKTQVYPMLVIEEITKKTLQGEQINYVLQGGSDSTSTVLLNQVDGEIFENSEDAKSTLINRATIQIEKLIANAVQKSNEWYQKSFSQVNEIHELPGQTQDESFVKLPDGTVARLKASA